MHNNWLRAIFPFTVFTAIICMFVAFLVQFIPLEFGFILCLGSNVLLILCIVIVLFRYTKSILDIDDLDKELDQSWDDWRNKPRHNQPMTKGYVDVQPRPLERTFEVSEPAPIPIDINIDKFKEAAEIQMAKEWLEWKKHYRQKEGEDCLETFLDNIALLEEKEDNKWEFSQRKVVSEIDTTV